VNNCHWVQGDAVRLPFGLGAFDVVFLVTVLGEVSQPRECMADIGRVLRPGGLLSVTEQKGDPDALSQKELLQLGEESGFEFLEQFSFFRGFTLNLRKVSGLERGPDGDVTCGREKVKDAKDNIGPLRARALQSRDKCSPAVRLYPPAALTRQP